MLHKPLDVALLLDAVQRVTAPTGTKNAARALPSREAPTASIGSAPCVLPMDDSAQNAHLLAAELRRAGAELQRTLTDLRSAVKVRDDFISRASHELKTPLTALQLQVQLLQKMSRVDVPSPRAIETKVSVIAGQVARLAALIDQLLAASCTAGAPMTLSRERVDLRDVVGAALVRSVEPIRQSGSKVSVRSESVSGSWDRFRIESAVNNIIMNAVKFGEGKPIEIDVGSSGEHARLVVRDHGIGIPCEALKRVFGKFETAVARDHYGGLGLGLWIAQQAIVAHGGAIRCESQPGAGSAFTVELPQLRQASE